MSLKKSTKKKKKKKSELWLCILLFIVYLSRRIEKEANEKNTGALGIKWKISPPPPPKKKKKKTSIELIFRVEIANGEMC